MESLNRIYVNVSDAQAKYSELIDLQKKVQDEAEVVL